MKGKIAKKVIVAGTSIQRKTPGRSRGENAECVQYCGEKTASSNTAAHGIRYDTKKAEA
jgi:hypothetical protein